ncbi:MAG: gamma-glutamyl-gamma-aminobutyrate hydrolase family protein [Victivallaceae bacterium]
MKFPKIGVNMVYRPNDDAGNVWMPMLYAVGERYIAPLRQAGAVVFLLPPVDYENGELDAALDMLDGVCLIGGFDYPPESYGRAPDAHTQRKRLRPESDFALARALLRRPELPVLGICGGCQLLNIASGGKLIVHLENAQQHTAGVMHEAEIVAPGHFAEAAGKKPGERIAVNSFHHQAIDETAIGNGFRITARAFDGTIEAVERNDALYTLGVQFHPERMESWAEKLFAAFVDVARNRH